jgi:hypothetical protein
VDEDTGKVYQRDIQYKNYVSKIKWDEGDAFTISWSGILRNDADYSMKGWLSADREEHPIGYYTEVLFKGSKIQSFAVS